MIVTGANIATKDDPLTKIKVEYFYHKLLQPNPEIEAKIRQLRIVREINPPQYSILKRQLPYVVCGIFNPLIRKTENFAYTEYFILDIDHIEEKGLELKTLKEKFKQDSRIILCFVSPGQDGLKLLFKLRERCYDAGVYSVFYKSFAFQFAREYSLEQVIDARTSDVSRACFVSMDPDAFYNPLADEIDMASYINLQDSSELLRQKKKLEMQFPTHSEVEEHRNIGPDSEAIIKIKNLLNPRYKNGIPTREVFVPEELDKILEGLTMYLTEAGIEIKQISNIQFGKKFQLMADLKEAEINLFYGKRGFSVIVSPRRGTNDELNKLMSQLIDQYVHTVT
jgi:hypothetical protein